MERTALRVVLVGAGILAAISVACGGGTSGGATPAASIARGGPQRVGLEVVSRMPDGTPGGSGAFAAVSTSGRFVAFYFGTDGLVLEDVNRQPDIFLRDREKGTTTLVSRAADGSSADGSAQETAISADGRFIAYVSEARNAVNPPKADRGIWDVYLWDREVGRSKRISSPPAGDGNGSSMSVRMSTNGRYVVFRSAATNLIAEDLGSGGFVYSADSGKLQRLSTRLAGSVTSCSPIAVSDDGRRVACWVVVQTPNGRSNRLILVDPVKGTTTDPGICLSSHLGAMSADGRFIATESCSIDAAGEVALIVHDLNTGSGERVVAAIEGFGNIAMSADGMQLAFETTAPLVAGDLNGRADVYFVDRLGSSTARLSVANDGADCGVVASAPSLSSDGHFVAFICSATEGNDPLGGDSHPDVYIRDGREQIPAGRVTPGATPVHGPARYPTPVPARTSLPGERIVLVAVDNLFNLGTIVTSSPVEVRFENHGGVYHSLHFLDRPNGATLAPGAEGPITKAGGFATIRFEVAAGTYYFQCDLHPSQMQGTLVVH